MFKILFTLLTIINIQNSDVSLGFDSQTGKMMSFVIDGKEMVPQGGCQADPWSISIQGPAGEAAAIPSAKAAFASALSQPESNSVKLLWTMRFNGSSDFPAILTVTLPANGGMPLWDFECKIPKGWVVTEVTAPSVEFKSGQDPKAIIPAYWGARRSAKNNQIHARYPASSCVMNFIMVDDADLSLSSYISAMEDSGNMKIYKLNGKTASYILQQTVPTSYAWTDAQGYFKLPWSTVVGLHRGNWEKAVLEWYRPRAIAAWAPKTINERPIASWLKDNDLWFRVTGVTEEVKASIRKGVEYFGTAGIHWYQWPSYKYDTHYPMYFPAKDGFKEMVAYAQSLGCHVTPYTNGRLWDSDNSLFKSKHGEKAMCLRPDGTFYTEIYASLAMNSVACPGSQIWLGCLESVWKDVVREMNTDGIYIDQLGCSRSETCYSKEHNHPQGGGDWWPQIYRKFVPEMRSKYLNSRQIYSTEECVECYLELFDMQLIVNAQHPSGTELIPLFPLVYSDRCIYSGFNYDPKKLNDGAYRWMMSRCFLWGSQIGWFDPKRILETAQGQEAELIRNLVTLRSLSHDIFVGGHFEGEFTPKGDNPLVTVPGYGKYNVVSGAKWTSTSGEQALLIVNTDSVDHAVEIPGHGTQTIKKLSATRL